MHLGLLVRGLPDEVLAGAAPRPPLADLSTDVDLAAAELRPVPRRLLGALAVLGAPARWRSSSRSRASTPGRVSDSDVAELEGPGPRHRHARGGPGGY